MNNNIKLVFAVLMFCGLTANAQEKVKIEADKKTSSVTYSMKHPMA